MHYDEFVGQVQARGRMANSEEAVRATRTTLQTLCERIPDGLAKNVASQLPAEIGEFVDGSGHPVGSQGAESFGRDEFISRLTQKSGVDEPVATFQARAVLDVINDAVGDDVMRKLRDALPQDIVDMIDAGSSGKMRNSDD